LQKKLWEQLNSFRVDPTIMEYVFPPSLSGLERKHLHHFAELQNLDHHSQGEGENRCIIVSKLDTTVVSHMPYPYAQYQWKDNRKGIAPSVTNNEILPYRPPNGPEKNSKGFSAEYVRFRLTNL